MARCTVRRFRPGCGPSKTLQQTLGRRRRPLMDPLTYFERELAACRMDEPVLACGYFRSHVGDPLPRGWGDLATMVEAAELFLAAARAHGFFIALTQTRLLVVTTRAPATRTPLLENLGVFEVPTEGLKVRVDSERLELDLAPYGKLVLATSLANPAFPEQGSLIEELSRRFGNATTLAALKRQQRNRWLRWAAVVAGSLAAGLLWAWLSNG